MEIGIQSKGQNTPSVGVWGVLAVTTGISHLFVLWLIAESDGYIFLLTWFLYVPAIIYTTLLLVSLWKLLRSTLSRAWKILIALLFIAGVISCVYFPWSLLFKIMTDQTY